MIVMFLKIRSSCKVVKRTDDFFTSIYIPRKMLERLLLQNDLRNIYVGGTGQMWEYRCSKVPNQVDVGNSQERAGCQGGSRSSEWKGRIIRETAWSCCRLLRRVWPGASWGLGTGVEKGPDKPSPTEDQPHGSRKDKTAAPTLVQIWGGRRRKDLSALLFAKALFRLRPSLIHS